jgi:hypothetical protein
MTEYSNLLVLSALLNLSNTVLAHYLAKVSSFNTYDLSSAVI